MKWGLAALVLVVACHRSSSSSPGPTALEASTPDPCAAITAARATVDAGAPSGFPVPLGAAETCVPTKRGAWGLVVEGSGPWLSPSLPPRIDLHVVHASASPGTTTRGPHEEWAAIDRLRAFDFDGDGEEELVVEGKRGCAIDQDLTCETPLTEVEVFTFAKGTIDLYRGPLASASFAVKSATMEVSNEGPPVLVRSVDPVVWRSADDVDGDGRPDLTSWLVYDLHTTDGDVTMYRLHGPTFVAHSLSNGDFSLDDDVARAALAKSCDATQPFETAKADGLVATAVCARLRGASVAEVIQRYVARCRPLQANVKRALADMIKGKGVDPDHVEWAAQGACRTEPEGGWSQTVGIPRALVALLEDTKPVLQKAPGAKP